MTETKATASDNGAVMAKDEEVGQHSSNGEEREITIEVDDSTTPIAASLKRNISARSIKDNNFAMKQVLESTTPEQHANNTPNDVTSVTSNNNNSISPSIGTSTRVRVFRTTSFTEDSKADETAYGAGTRLPRQQYNAQGQSNFSFRDTFIPHHRQSTTVKTAPRLIGRNLYYNQSHNQFNVKNNLGQHRHQMLWNLYKYDWFHVMLRWRTSLSALFLVAVWTGIILVFGGFYMLADRVDPKVDCGLHPDGPTSEPIQWHTAFAFSLETCTTVGYGLPGSSSAFFNNCPGVQITIYFQMLVSMMFNAFLLAFFFSRLGRCEARAYQVVFTDKACIRRDYTHGGQGRLKFECKVYDADSRFPVVEAHVRMYVVHCRSPSRNYWPLRITTPNDELGSMLCTSIPSHVSHHIDLYSPLLPPKFRPRNIDKSISTIVHNHGLVLREVDSYTGNRDGIICPICGESYGTFNRFLKHVNYNKMMENYCDIPEQTLKTLSHHVLDDKTLQRMKDSISLDNVTYEDINRYWQETKMEVVVLVEGIDPLTSGTFQALHSYQAEDIFYGGQFAVSFTTDNTVDFDLFQTVELVEHNTNDLLGCNNYENDDDDDDNEEVEVNSKKDS